MARERRVVLETRERARRFAASRARVRPHRPRDERVVLWWRASKRRDRPGLPIRL